MAWSVTVTDANNATRSPTILAQDGGPQPQWIPSANGLPEVRIPVPYDETWQDAKYEDADMVVEAGDNGTQLPIEQLDDVQHRTDHTVLIGRGGVELRQRVTPEYDVQEIHTAADNLITNNTNYATNVDTPSTTTSSNVTVQSADTTTEFLGDLVEPIPDETPLEARNGNVELLQSCFVEEAEDGRSNVTTTTEDVGIWSGAQYVELSAVDDYVEFDFTIDYDIPAGHLDVSARVGLDGGISDGPKLNYYIDGYRMGGAVNGFSISGDTSWIRQDAAFRLEAGKHTARVELISTASDNAGIDVLAVSDNRFSYNFDNTTDSNDALAGPELFPDSVQYQFADAQVTRAVTGGRIETTWDDTTGNQALALSNDRGETYSTSANSSTFETDFTDRGATLRHRPTWARYGSQTSTPTSGINGQKLQSYTLKADLETMPLVVSEAFDARLVDVLATLANTTRGDFLWSVSDPDEDGDLTIQWTQPGQRSASQTPDVADYEVAKQTSAVVEKAVVRGGVQAVPEERFTASHGSAVSLDNDRIVAESETVFDPDADGRVEFLAGSDYTIDYDAGEITTQSGGDMTDGDEYAIAYRFKPLGSHDNGASNPKTETYRLPSLGGDRACRLAARRIVNAAEDPIFEATATIPGDDVSYSVVEAINPSALPTDGNSLEIVAVEAVADQTVLTLANRESTSDVVAGLSTRLSNISERV